MRNWLFMMLITFFSAVLHAGEKESDGNLFACVDKQTLIADTNCVQATVSSKFKVQENAIDYAALSGDLGDNALATMHFYPEKQLIQIVGHLENSNEALSAKVLKTN